MITCSELDQQLDDFLDGRLAAAEAQAVHAHLATCGDCRARTEALQRVLAAAATLPRDIRPAHTLWPAIAARLPARNTDVPLRSIRWRRWVPLAAAAAVLIAVTAILTARLVREPPQLAEDPGVAAADAAQLAAAREYELAAEDLERLLREGRERLSPATVQVLERNLALIDAAIAEARAALAADPANASLRALLLGARRQKLELLERASRLTRS